MNRLKEEIILTHRMALISPGIVFKYDESNQMNGIIFVVVDVVVALGRLVVVGCPLLGILSCS